MEIFKGKNTKEKLIVKNVYKKDIDGVKIQDILLKSYKNFIRNEVEKCLRC